MRLSGEIHSELQFSGKSRLLGLENQVKLPLICIGYYQD